MTYRAPQQASSGPRPGPCFTKASPLAEGVRALSEFEIRQAFSSFHPRNAADMALRFSGACAALGREFGAQAALVEAPSGGLRFVARLEFLTEDRSLDQDLNQKVAGRGFQLKLHCVPVTSGTDEERYERRSRTDGGGRRVEFTEQRMVRRYVVSESEATSRIDRAVKSVEELLQLAAEIRPAGIAEDLPGKVVPIERVRASRPPPRADAAEPIAEGPAQMQGGKAS